MSKYIFTKNGSLERPKNVSKDTFNSLSFGTEFIYEPVNNPITFYFFTASAARETDEFKKVRSLKNIINKKNSLDEIFNYDTLEDTDFTLISISSLNLGNGIKKGTVALNYYYTGTLLNSARDTQENGVLYDSNDTKVGFVLYNEGFVCLTGSIPLSSPSTEFVGYGAGQPKWFLFGALSASNSYFHCDMNYEVNNSVPTKTIFVHANKNTLNHSNNNTHLVSGSYSIVSNTSSSFKENSFIEIKKTNKSPFVSGSAEFEKQTFITKIGLYDEEKKLIGVATLANPIRKTENREFLFKLKLDI